MIEFKYLETADWDKIQMIAYETWPDTFGLIIPDEQIAYMLNQFYNEESLKKQMLDNGHKFILAQKEDRPLGFISYQLNYNSEPKLMIHKLYILPEAQGLGIGSNLLQHLSDIASQNNNNKLCLKVFFKNTNAISFYKKQGFKKIGTETTDIGNNYSILDDIMIRLI